LAAKLVELGRNVTFSIAPITIDGTTGAITVGTVLPLTGKAKRGAMRPQRESERIEALDATIANNVYLGKDNWSLELAGIRYKVGTNPNPLMDTFMAGAYGQIVVTTSTKVYTFQGLISTATLDVGGPGEVDDVVTLIPIDTGAANPGIA
jgi:hypothetical protein